MRTKTCPQARWVPVVDGAGHRHLEMRWSVPGEAVPAARPVAPAGPRAA
ncbi:hypothetical protein SAMN06893096_102390 [Geodermatophilus pulveris]|uniref:Uncharacterized protein n=1 Tax=Geodermatophilus pulveris TaxID=1564159 RepID=A0A239CE78_9ACTN|nr:hypothetical protein [Geodermatophilus pulveris]SNS18249.1 hypothetical protein SAMN06893096_102390 [Geodermatophilus pulveris]